jgi:sulfite reductase (NADPH) flavoprotein alpha-component
MGISEFRGPGLSDTQWDQIKALAEGLDAKQLLWVSGFFAGIEYRFSGVGRDASRDAVDDFSSAQDRRLTVLYGSETGNSAAVAARLVEEFAGRGRLAHRADMAAYKTRELKDEQDLIIITSTYGDGDPPQPGVGFFEFVEGRKAPKFTDLRFAVLALGDSTYEHFCAAGKKLDRRLEELGGVRLVPRADCDVDYEETAAKWAADVVSLLATDSAPPQLQIFATRASEAKASVFDKHHPFLAEIRENIALTGRGSTKETRHVEISLDGSGLAFEPGDALGILPRNDPKLVEAVLAAVDSVSSSRLTVKDAEMTIGEALTHRFDVVAVTPRFIEHWALLSGSDRLRSLVSDEHGSERTDFIRKHHVIDVLRQYPVKGITPDQFAAVLRPLQPRLYSIASSFLAAPGEAHLTVSTVRYELSGVPRTGVVSGHLAERAEVGDALSVYVQSNSNFRLPADDVPIIMIGAGTGVAPFRAFMQEREVRSAPGRSWLFFGERNFRTDFLYQLEWHSWLKDGVLSRMDVAFSRDISSPEGPKSYVQNRLEERAAEVFAWLEEGAHLYVCGDATGFARGVQLALKTIVAEKGSLGPVATDEYLARLREDRRYHLDVY